MPSITIQHTFDIPDSEDTWEAWLDCTIDDEGDPSVGFNPCLENVNCESKPPEGWTEADVSYWINNDWDAIENAAFEQYMETPR
jgi:hypothetical protein